MTLACFALGGLIYGPFIPLNYFPDDPRARAAFDRLAYVCRAKTRGWL
jgi:hypothetical protein